MTPTVILEELRRRGVELSCDGGGLKVRAPRGVLTEQDRSLLALHKADLVRLLQPAPVSADRYEPFPLTDIQAAYLVGRSPGLPLGNVGCHAYRELDRAELDVPRLERAWQRLVERHDMLRAVITADTQQRVLPDVPPYRIAVLDVRSRADADAALDAVRAEMSHRLFDPTQWPLFEIRATLLSDRVRIHISLDLLIADAASMLVLFQEWGELYANPDSALPPVPALFRDHVLSEAAARGSDLYRRASDYWGARLVDLPGGPELPLARRPETIDAPRFVRHARRLDPDTWRRLKERAAARGLTPSALLAAAYGDVLAAWSRDARFLVTLTLFRSHPQVAGVVGDFTSTILLEVDATAGTFAERATQLQTRLAQDLEHSAMSGVAVLREMNRVRRQGAPAVPVVFTSALGHRHADGGRELPLAWLGTTVFAITQTPQIFIDHHVVEDGGALLASWDVVSELFPQGLVEDMFAAHGRLLQSLHDDDEAWDGNLGLVPEEQLTRRAAVNASDMAVPDHLMHEPFEDWARREPERLAVAGPRGRLTYGELNARADGVAARLRAEDVAPGTLVAVAMEKGWEQVVATLGILKAGAAYLPIDPGLPAERSRQLMERGQVRIVLTQSDRPVEVVTGATLIAVDREPPAPAGPAPRVAPHDLAYVIYTSGSTGAPKGVMIDHRAAVNTLVDMNHRFGVGPDDRVLALSSLSFDLSVFDIFGTLAAGGTIVMPAPDSERDPEHWLQLAAFEGVTVWNSVPALMGMALELDWPLPASLRLVMLSGDWIPLSLPDRIRRSAPQAEVVSLGGATEAAIWSIYHRIGRVDPAWASVPYGTPLANQQFHVLDARGEPRPDWAAGPLHIGGVGLARGYWRDPERTAERFVHHPRTGERLYVTGDVGRYLPDGSIELLGRDDLQVKVNGHRIELGEIEAALESHPRVGAAVAVAAGDPRGARRIVAYVVPRGAPAPADAFAALATEGVLQDSAARYAFTIERRGLRRDLERALLPLAPRVDRTPADDASRRRTYRQFAPAAVARESFNRLLACLADLDDDAALVPRRRYPSAGSLYPVQIYLHVKSDRVEGTEAGTYLYDPARHGLVAIDPTARLDGSLHAAVNRAAFESAAFSLFLVADLDAIRPMYGAIARDLCLLEAGYIGQLLMTEASLHGLGLCPIGTIDTDRLRPLLRLENHHDLIHSFVAGAPAAVSVLPASSSVDAPVPLAADLRSWLAAKLPEYMVPAAFIEIDALPLTGNGKIDRSALDGAMPEAAPRSAPPVTAGERAVAAVVASVIGHEPGRDDSFFDVGGNSLHMVRIHRILRDQFGADLAVVDLFRCPTVAALAQLLEGAAAKHPAAERGRARAEARRSARRERAERAPSS